MVLRRLTAAALATVLAFGGAAPGWAAPVSTHVEASSAFPASRPESVGFSADGLKALDAHMQGLVDAGHLPGVTTMLVRHGKVVNFEVHGKKGFDGPPMTKDTVFRIYSQSKPVTGVAMMILFEEGKWKLDDPVSKYIPEFASLRVFKGVNSDGSFDTVPADRPPTMREIMSHSGGFAYGLVPDNPIDKAYVDTGVLGSKSSDEFIKRVAALPLVAQPGTRWKYSVSVDIQGLIVEKLSGMSLGDFMQKRIFTPLKMVDTGFWLPAEKTSRLASLYAWGPKVHKLVPADGFMVLDISKPPVMASGGGGLVSTNADYARFAQMLLNGGELDGARILKPETVKLMRTNMLSDTIMNSDIPPFNTAKGRGFGLDFAVVLDSAKAGPQGNGTYSWGGAAGTWFWIDPTNDLFFLGMIHILNKDGDPAIAHIDQDSAKFVYDALKDPSK
ncbi:MULTISPECIES: serine hydrolase domain-containing protein [Caulobacter]|jgi:CubicO group peptidase (beta-lactamase class C family)|uniref:Penicillin-binding protein, beta-lactamase class C n=1 Tax=Caulobacter vibrioides OR37 TaxID=1292034 RepID=R0EHB7_CAUVI|nr:MULTISPECIES: serine hydrolase domain-containing protein [Caulobacter]ENZ81439.1 penicillin-binding protein, beta-lactamase class C [Caulobacter vibrioides OR37]MBQ1560692.1 beta-lactamase family protein [Caulobacter sp.]